MCKFSSMNSVSMHQEPFLWFEQSPTYCTFFRLVWIKFHVLESWKQDRSGGVFRFHISSILRPGRRFLWASRKFTFLQNKTLKWRKYSMKLLRGWRNFTTKIFWSGKWRILSRKPGVLGCLVCFVVLFLMKLCWLVQNTFQLFLNLQCYEM